MDTPIRHTRFLCRRDLHTHTHTHTSHHITSQSQGKEGRGEEEEEEKEGEGMLLRHDGGFFKELLPGFAVLQVLEHLDSNLGALVLPRPDLCSRSHTDNNITKVAIILTNVVQC